MNNKVSVKWGQLQLQFEDEELDPAATVKASLTVQTEGARAVQRPVTLYNLDATIDLLTQHVSVQTARPHSAVAAALAKAGYPAA